ncbi:glycosyltransferase family 4 protein [Agrococcus terreus]|uniref:glycosyltransferase family 4 protein n=1 Tax=Agrococcus terreus TaxID=574649 RepID=UPI00384C4977
MRILLLTHYFEPEEGAPQRRWRALLERFVAAGNEVDVICPPPHYPGGRMEASLSPEAGRWGVTTTEYGVRVHRTSYLWHDGRIALRSLDHLWVAFAAVRAAQVRVAFGRLRPDVIIATAPGLPTLLAGNLLSRTLRVPLVAEMRDAWPDLVSHTPGFQRQQGALGRVKHAVHERVTELQRRAAHVVTTTEAFAAVLGERGMRGTSVIRNGTQVERYSALPRRVNDHEELRVLYMGTIGRSQGLDVLIRAAAKLRDEGRPVAVRIIGAGADVQRLRSLNSALGEVVDLLPSVPGSQVADHYMWADTCVVSLRDWEPFKWTVPSKLYELLAAGRHISGIVAGESAALIERTRSGDVIAPGDIDALAALWTRLAQDRSALEIGPDGRRWALQHVDYDVLARHYLTLLEDVVERTPRTKPDRRRMRRG